MNCKTFLYYNTYFFSPPYLLQLHRYFARSATSGKNYNNWVKSTVIQVLVMEKSKSHNHITGMGFRFNHFPSSFTLWWKWIRTNGCSNIVFGYLFWNLKNLTTARTHAQRLNAGTSTKKMKKSLLSTWHWEEIGGKPSKMSHVIYMFETTNLCHLQWQWRTWNSQMQSLITFIQPNRIVYTSNHSDEALIENHCKFASINQ